MIMAGILAFLVVDSWEHPNRLIALGGFFVLIAVGVVFSKHPKKVRGVDWFVVYCNF